jgi:hypothetical protein
MDNISEAQSVSLLRQKSKGFPLLYIYSIWHDKQIVLKLFCLRTGTNHLGETLCCILYFKHVTFDTIQKVNNFKRNILPSES